MLEDFCKAIYFIYKKIIGKWRKGKDDEHANKIINHIVNEQIKKTAQKLNPHIVKEALSRL